MSTVSWSFVGLLIICLCLETTTLQPPCLKNQFECSDGRLCISMRYRCDVDRDCFDGSDESGCEDHWCTERHYQCPEGKCVPESWVCDGFEMGLDCRNGSDEKDCIPCLNNEFRCSDGKCIPTRWRCNGVDDCDDSGDERDCPKCHGGDHRCGSGNCLAASLVCDGIPDCKDQSDEKGCGECKNWGCSHFCNQTKPRPHCYCAEGFELNVKDKRSCIGTGKQQWVRPSRPRFSITHPLDVLSDKRLRIMLQDKLNKFKQQVIENEKVLEKIGKM